MTADRGTDNFEDALGRLVRRALGGTLTGLRRLTGGASQEIWSFDAETSSDATGYVLRRLPGGALEQRPSATGLEIEAAVIRAVAAQGVPVPEVVYVLTLSDGLGRGFIATRMPGEALGRRIVRDASFATVRPTLAARCGEILALIHHTPRETLPALASRTPAGVITQLEHQLARYGNPRPVYEIALSWLRDHCPNPAKERLVHGDFRTGNFLIEPTGLTAVLDWEGCHLGDPMADIGWLCMPTWRFGRTDLPVGGFGRREDLLAAYATACGTPVDVARIRFWEIASMVRWGLVCAMMADEFANGTRSIERAAIGRRASEADIEIMSALTDRGR